ncbi:hypothetical protein FVE67_04835 [Thermosulfurimonas marina]|uniref:NADH:ubiquinone oxidoreductase-like 20kDa subunit domain-containing protein n=1 Tax=Thermosulfurimonas marina TaxID=2047767 RepID=A0A6H1WSG4_9BACT|nr:hypothetical protein [Thermosulfurimonas marina]QJA06165.1 hypothetical protein FVE67_04835 [Thermosulfurimonas marina]
MKIALYNGVSCGGCDLVFFLEALEPWLEDLEVVFWPEMGASDPLALQKSPDRGLDLAVVCGAVRTESQKAFLKLLRTKARRMMAVGACALWGGLPGLSWLAGEGPWPATEVVKFETQVPGCPPEPHTLVAALEGRLAEVSFPLCQECPRERRPFRWRTVRFLAGGPSRECFLAQGILCAGPVTRGGCGAACVKAGRPCLGCYGFLPGRGPESLLDLVASALTPAKAEEVLEALQDPVGLLSPFTLAIHPLVRRRYAPDKD